MTSIGARSFEHLRKTANADVAEPVYNSKCQRSYYPDFPKRGMTLDHCPVKRKALTHAKEIVSPYSIDKQIGPKTDTKNEFQLSYWRGPRKRDHQALFLETL